MQIMAERETLYTLAVQVHVDDACPGGERTGGKRGLEKSYPYVAAVSIADILCISS